MGNLTQGGGGGGVNESAILTLIEDNAVAGAQGVAGPAGPAGTMMISTLYAPSAFRALGTSGYSTITATGWRDTDWIIVRTASSTTPGYLSEQSVLTANVLVATQSRPYSSIGGGTTLNGNAIGLYPHPTQVDGLQVRGTANADYVVDIKGVTGGTLVAPTPQVIFEGDVSAQTAADRVITLNFPLPETGRLHFTGDTASLDVDPQLDTVGKNILIFGEIYCEDLQSVPVTTEAQLPALSGGANGSWNDFPLIPLYHLGVRDSSNPANEDASPSTSGVGIFVVRISATKLGVKIGKTQQTPNNQYRDLAPLKIRWIP